MTVTTVSVSDESVAFGLEYDGPALASHEMDVRDLASALLSTANLYQDLSRTRDPTAPGVGVNVHATSEGSFLVELRLVVAEVERAALGTPTVASLIGLLAGSGYLVDLFKKRRQGREISQTHQTDGNARLDFGDGTSLELPEWVLRAANVVSVQRNLEQMIRPLDREGVDSLVIRREGIEVTRIDKDDAPAFSGPGAVPQGVTLSVTDRETYLTIRTAAFASTRWSFSEGDSHFQATIRDEAFIARVHSGEAFSELDILKCRIRQTQTREPTGTLGIYIEVLEVQEHIPPPGGTPALPGTV
jgi:hypothetical protein